MSVNRNNLENISPFRRDSSSSAQAASAQSAAVINLNQSQRLFAQSSQKKISSQSRGQYSHRCNSSISNTTNNNNTFANSSMNLNYNLNNTSINNNNNENSLSTSLLRTSLITHSKQFSIGSISNLNHQNININSNNNVNNNMTQQQQSQQQPSYSQKTISQNEINENQKNSQINNNLSINSNNKLHSQQSQLQSSHTLLKQNSIKKYSLQQQQQPNSSHSIMSQPQQQQNQNQNVSHQQTKQSSQIPPFHFEKGLSKTHRGHTSSQNNFSYIQQQQQSSQNSSVSNILGNSQKQNLNQATPPNKRLNTMPCTTLQQQQGGLQSSSNISQVNDENVMHTLSSSINISTYKVSPRLLKNNSSSTQSSMHQQQTPQQQSIINFAQNQSNSAYGLGNNTSNTQQSNLINNTNNLNLISQSSQSSQSSNLMNSQNLTINRSSSSCNNSNNNSKHSYSFKAINQIPTNQSISMKRVNSSQEGQTICLEDEEDQIQIDKMKNEIETFKQREVQYLTRINVLESENKNINESVQTQENNIKSLKKELIKYQQQTISSQPNENNIQTNKENNNISQNDSTNVNVQLQQKQIAMLEQYVDTLSKKLQQLELEQIRQQSSNPVHIFEKQYNQQKNKYKQLFEKYLTLEKLYGSIKSENDYFRTNLNQLKNEYQTQQQNLNSSNNHHIEPTSQSSVLKALQMVSLNKQ